MDKATIEFVGNELILIPYLFCRHLNGFWMQTPHIPIITIQHTHRKHQHKYNHNYLQFHNKMSNFLPIATDFMYKFVNEIKVAETISINQDIYYFISRLHGILIGPILSIDKQTDPVFIGRELIRMALNVFNCIG